MRLHAVAALALLSFAAGRSVSAQAPTKCTSPEITITAEEPILSPEGYMDASVSVFNTEDGTAEDVGFSRLDTRRGSGRMEFIPDAWVVNRLEELKQASVKAPEKFQLLWKDTTTQAECLQRFTVLFQIPQRVLLNEAGIESRYVNPVAPVPIDGRPLQFVNDSGDRTFVITIPFVYSTAEVANSYALARRNREERSLAEVVCSVDSANIPCPEQELKDLEALRILLESVSQAGAATLKSDCGKKQEGTAQDKTQKTENDQPATPEFRTGSCFAEYAFWHAVRDFYPSDLERFAASNGDSPKIQAAVEKESTAVIEGFLKSGEAFPAARDFEAAYKKQDSISFQSASDDALAHEVEISGLQARFNAARTELAKRALVAEIRKRMGFAPPADRKPSRTVLGRFIERYLKRPGIEGPGFTCEIQEFLDKLDAARDSWNDGDIYSACKRREAQAASKLLLSYSPDATVPYSGLPATMLSNPDCRGLIAHYTPTVKSDPGERNPQRADFLEMERMFNAESLSEQGIEITNCTSDGTKTTCSATATIPPYGMATFSRSMLAHHPGARIRFTASFFGDTEIPGNANGHVTRSDATAADEKPKRSFSLQIGGDASLSREPDKTIGGQLDHATATGSLAFQFVGPVEASATLQFKSGDLGGKSSQTTATQYQAKVYGPNRLVLQYGNITFAKPTSGVAVNVTGEGVQLIAGGASLGYVVQRESDSNEANKEDQDKSLVYLQVRNKQIGAGTGLFRTADFIALYGKEEKAPTMDAPSLRPYHFWSAGFEARIGSKRVPSLGSSIAFYYSERDMDSSEPTMDPKVLQDGKGHVIFLRTSWTDLQTPSWREKQEIRPAFGVTGFAGYGSGDKSTSFDKDEGYLGENAGYANDMIFLSKVASSEAFSSKLGKGLSNKTYAGLQLTTWRLSPLAGISKLIGAEKDIASRSTILTLHKYWFNHDFDGESDAGKEVNLSFNLEAPKNIQWVLSGAYYDTPPAIERLLGRKDGLWMASAKLSIKLDNL